MNREYDIRSIFEEMELELIRSMRRNLEKHQKWEEDEGINWTMWQAEQLKSFDKFKKQNEKIFGKRFATVNAEIREFLERTYETAGLDQEKEILEVLSKGKQFKDKTEKGLEGSFFQLNKKKMHALIDATTNDLSKAEHAMLRLTNDQYRKIIYKAETMFNSGAFNLKQSIDAASRDFLKAGINCVEYKDGRRVNIASYAEMCLRTSNKRAKFTAEGDVRKAYGITTVKISRYGGCSETCLPWQGKVYVDDVWSGGTKEEAEDKKLPLLSTAIEGNLFHPNCKHSMFTYYYDRKKTMGKLQEDGIEVIPEEQEHRRNHLHIQQQKRLEEGSLNPQNIQEAKNKKEQWIKKDNELGYSKKSINQRVNYMNLQSVSRIGSNEVDLDEIKSSSYRKKFNQLTSNSKVNDVIRAQSTSILTAMKNSDTERLVILDADTGNIIFSKTGFKDALEVELSNEEVNYIRNYKGKKIALHNHPTNLLPTGGDFGSAGYRKYDFGLVLCHDGKVYQYSAGEIPFSSSSLDKRIDKYKNEPYNMDEIEAHKRVLNEFREEYEITWKELK